MRLLEPTEKKWWLLSEGRVLGMLRSARARITPAEFLNFGGAIGRCASVR